MKHKPLKNSKSIWGQLELIHTTYNDDILSALYRKFPDLICKYTYLAKIPIYTAVVVVILSWKKRMKKNVSLTPFCSSKYRTSCMAGSNISLSILVKVIPKGCRAFSWPQCYSKIGKDCGTSHIDI